MKILIAHPDQQHSYKLANAVNKCGHLFKYATTVYYKKSSKTYYISRFLPLKIRRKAINRHTTDIKDDDIVLFCEGLALIKLLFQNISFLHRWYNKLRYKCADTFAKRVAKYAIRNNIDMVITYDDCSPKLFEILKENAPQIIRVLDVSAANRLFMKDIYYRDAQIATSFSEKLKLETPQVWNEEILEKCKKEIELSNYYLSPSEFVNQSLEYSNVCKEKVFLCPYGVDTSIFKPKTDYQIHSPIKFVYVGGITELKGIYYLLEAFWDIPPDVATLTLIGDAGLESKELEKYKNKYYFMGRVFHDDLPGLLQKFDVFVFPSLGDSFSFACVECASVGLPLIVTENTGMKDYINEGQEGFIIPVQSVESIRTKIDWFIRNPEQIEIMGKKGSRMASSITWENYNDSIKKFIDYIIETEQQK